MRKAWMLVPVAAAAVGTAAFAGEADIETLRRYKALMEKINERIIVVSETARSRDAQEMKKLVQTLESVDKSLAAVAPDSILKTSAQRSDSLLRLSRESQAKGNLGSIRAGLSIYYGDTEGVYPRNPQALVPKYMQAVPTLELPDHQPTNGVRIMTKVEGDKLEGAVSDSGKWLYIDDPKSPLNGTILIDCTHKDSKGRVWWQY